MTETEPLLGMIKKSHPTPKELIVSQWAAVKAWQCWNWQIFTGLGESATYIKEAWDYGAWPLLTSIVVTLSGMLMTSVVKSEIGDAAFEDLSTFRSMEWYLSALAYGIFASIIPINLLSGTIEKDEKEYRRKYDLADTVPIDEFNKEWAKIGFIFWNGLYRAGLNAAFTSIALVTFIPAILANLYSLSTAQTLNLYLICYAIGSPFFYAENAFSALLNSKFHGRAVFLIKLLACIVGNAVNYAAISILANQEDAVRLCGMSVAMGAQYFTGAAGTAIYTVKVADKQGKYAMFPPAKFNAAEFFGKIPRGLGLQIFIGVEMTVLVINQYVSTKLGNKSRDALGVAMETIGVLVVIAYTISDGMTNVLNRRLKNGEKNTIPNAAISLLLFGFLVETFFSALFFSSNFCNFVITLFGDKHNNSNGNPQYVQSLLTLTKYTMQYVAVGQPIDFLRLAGAALLRGLDSIYLSAAATLIFLFAGCIGGYYYALPNPVGIMRDPNEPGYDLMEGLFGLLTWRNASLLVLAIFLLSYGGKKMQPENQDKGFAELTGLSIVGKKLGSLGLFKYFNSAEKEATINSKAVRECDEHNFGREELRSFV